MDIIGDLGMTALKSGISGAAYGVGSALTSSSNPPRKKRLRGSEFVQDQNENLTTGFTNCIVVKSTKDNTLTLNQRGKWRPDPPDRRSYLYRLMIPRFNLTFAVTGNPAETLTIGVPERRLYSFYSLNTSQLADYRSALSDAYDPSTNNQPGQPDAQAYLPTNSAQMTNKFETLDAFKLIQWQQKFLFKNVSSNRVILTIFDYICRRDTSITVETLMEDYLQNKQTGDQFKTAVKNAIAEIGATGDLREPTFNPAAADGGIEPHDGLDLSKMASHVGRYWRCMKQSVVTLEPGGMLHYVQSMYNVKVRNQDLTTTYSTDALPYMEAKSRALVVFINGQLLSGPTTGQSVLTYGDGRVVLERLKNITLEAPHVPTLPHLIGVPPSKVGPPAYVFPHIAAGNQSKTNVRADTNVPYVETL